MKVLKSLFLMIALFASIAHIHAANTLTAQQLRDYLSYQYPYFSSGSLIYSLLIAQAAQQRIRSQQQKLAIEYNKDWGTDMQMVPASIRALAEKVVLKVQPDQMQKILNAYKAYIVSGGTRLPTIDTMTQAHGGSNQPFVVQLTPEAQRALLDEVAQLVRTQPDLLGITGPTSQQDAQALVNQINNIIERPLSRTSASKPRPRPSDKRHEELRDIQLTPEQTDVMLYLAKKYLIHPAYFVGSRKAGMRFVTAYNNYLKTINSIFKKLYPKAPVTLADIAPYSVLTNNPDSYYRFDPRNNNLERILKENNLDAPAVSLFHSLKEKANNDRHFKTRLTYMASLGEQDGSNAYAKYYEPDQEHSPETNFPPAPLTPDEEKYITTLIGQLEQGFITAGQALAEIGDVPHLITAFNNHPIHQEHNVYINQLIAALEMSIPHDHPHGTPLNNSQEYRTQLQAILDEIDKHQQLLDLFEQARAQNNLQGQ